MVHRHKMRIYIYLTVCIAWTIIGLLDEKRKDNREMNFNNTVRVWKTQIDIPIG